MGKISNYGKKGEISKLGKRNGVIYHFYLIYLKNNGLVRFYHWLMDQDQEEK